MNVDTNLMITITAGTLLALLLFRFTMACFYYLSGFCGIGPRSKFGPRSKDDNGPRTKKEYVIMLAKKRMNEIHKSVQ